MRQYFHVNGELCPTEEATVNVRDRGFLYGDAAFETLRAYGGTIFEWEAHVTRLQTTAETLGMADAVPNKRDLATRIRETLMANDLADAYVRLSITRGVQPGKLTPRPEVDPTVVIIVEELPRGGCEGAPVWDGPATVRTVQTQQIPDEAIPATAKTHNYLNGILARLELRRSTDDSSSDRSTTTEEDSSSPADEALLHNREGHLIEGTTSNLFFVSDGVLRTPSVEEPLLPGVTRQTVLDLARRHNIPVETGCYTIADVRSATEAFLTNTTWELRPITTINGATISNESGTITERLQQLFCELVEHRHYMGAEGNP
jgi:branched-chain amino acid aminotransferase